MEQLRKRLRPGGEIRNVLRALRKHKLAMIGGVLVGAFLFTATLGPFLAPYDPIQMHLNERFEAPSLRYILGTDEYGRDVLSRLIYGARVSLEVTVVAVPLALLIGILIGSISGYYGGKVDFALMRLVDIVTSFPVIILAVGIMSILGRGVDKLILVFPILFWTEHARISRGVALYVRQMDYIQAAKVFGASNTRIILNHILINVLPPLIVVATFQLGTAILIESSLSFLGLGISPPYPSWGNMLTNAREYILNQPLLAVFPGIAITLTILGFNILGDALRDALDPRLRK